MAFTPRKHLHIAFATAPRPDGGHSIAAIAWDPERREVARLHTAAEGEAKFHPWQALLAGIQMAVDLGADQITLYSHHGNLANMARLSRGQSEASPGAAAYGAVAWQILFGAFMGRFAFTAIDEARNPAIAVAQGEAVEAR